LLARFVAIHIESHSEKEPRILNSDSPLLCPWVSDGGFDVVGSGDRSVAPNAHFKSWLTQNFQWIFCHCGANFASFGLMIIWNHAFN